MPITINGVPLVSEGAVNRQVIGTIARTGGAQTFFELHPKALESATARSAPRGLPPDPEAIKTVKSGLRAAGFVAGDQATSPGG